MPLTPNQMGDAVIRNLPAKTGHSVDEWIALIRKDGPSGRRERVAQVVRGFGPDAILDLRQAYVALRRDAQFVLVQPSARDRVDLGLVLPGVAPTGRLRPAGSFGTGSTTHRVALASPGDVDEEVT